MLQQTTTTAVIPYFERFIQKFPTLKSLANAKIESVLEAWAGLGYYSRARNLHKSAQALAALAEFPRSSAALAELPGFGPYTSRSVASLAFEESVGVVDGNVIRVLSRFEAADWEWWQSRTRHVIQEKADAWVQGFSSRDMNQALMELGRTICTPRSPTCLLCPLRPGCAAFQNDSVAQFPKARPKRAREIWHWQAQVCIKNGQLLLGLNDSLPFLKGQWMLPGAGERLKKAPKSFHYRHSITHHDIFVTVVSTSSNVKSKGQAFGQTKWIPLKELKQNVPVSLVHKAISAHNRLDKSDSVLKSAQSSGRSNNRAARSHFGQRR